MKDSSAISRGYAPGAAVLLGIRASRRNDVRRRAQQIRAALHALGLNVSLPAVRIALAVSTALALGAAVIGIMWAPGDAGLERWGIPLPTSALVTMACALLGAGLLQARHRHSRVHPSWAGLSPATEIGLRAGPLLVDFVFVLMLVVQCLRWHESHNLVAASSLILAAAVALCPGRSLREAGLWAIGAGSVVVGPLLVIAPLLRTFGGSLPAGLEIGVWMAGSGLVLATGPITVVLYLRCAPRQSMRSRGLLIDLAVKTTLLSGLSLLAVVILEATPWYPVGPYAGLTVYFLGLLCIRTSFVRITSMEALGCALLLLRLVPRRQVRAMHRRSLLIATVLCGPAGGALGCWLLFRGQWSEAVVLGALLVLELGLEALILQRTAAVLPASSMARLPQESKAGLAAALSGGMAVTFTGVLTATGVHGVPPSTALVAGGCMTAVAGLLLALAIHDVPAWISEITATDSEE